MKKLFALSFATTTVVASLLQAHPGPRIWIGNVGGQITTFDSDNDIDPSIFTASRLFLSGGEDDNADSSGNFEDIPGSYSTTWPGYEVKPGTTVYGGSTIFSFNIAGPLLKFDPQTDTYRSVNDLFASSGQIPREVVSQNANIRMTSTGSVTGFNFIQSNSHNHLDLTFYGDGTQPSDGPAGTDGVYALPMQLTASGFTSSQTYYVLMGKNTALGEHEFTEAQRVAKDLVGLVPSHTWDAGFTQPTLYLRHAAVVEVPASGTSSGVVRLNKLLIDSATGAYDGTLQLHDNDLIVDYTGGPSPYADVVNYVKKGLTLLGGNGTGIGSSEVDSQLLQGTMLAVVDNQVVGGAITETSGAITTAESVIVKYTWFGDSNFDGKVDGSDYALLDSGFTSGGSLGGWVFGDYDYNGTVDGSDYALIDTGFISQNAILPEPAGLVVIGLSAFALNRKRRA